MTRFKPILKTEMDRAQIKAARKNREIEKLRNAIKDATELFGEIMRDEVNHQDEAEKWLRAYGEICPANARDLAPPP